MKTLQDSKFLKVQTGEIPERWEEGRLGDLCEKIGSGATPRGGKESYETSGVSLIRSQNVFNEGFSTNGLAFINESQAKDLDNVSVISKDVLLNITGESVARCCMVPDDILPARVNQHVSIIRPAKDHLDPKYLRYFFISRRIQQHMLALASSGATRQALTKGMIENFVITYPSLKEQRAIAKILSDLFERGGSRNGLVVLVESKLVSDPETQQQFTIKRYKSEKENLVGDKWRHKKIILSPDNKSFKDIILKDISGDDFCVVAEFVEVLG